MFRGRFRLSGVQSAGGDAGWLVPTAFLSGSTETNCVGFGKTANWNQHQHQKMVRLPWWRGSLGEAHWIRGDTELTVLLSTPHLLARTQMRAAGKADVWFRESWFCITKQNTEELADSCPVRGRLMKHRKDVQKALDSTDMTCIHSRAISFFKAHTSLQERRTGPQPSVSKCHVKWRRWIEAKGTHSNVKKWHLTSKEKSRKKKK